MSTPSSSLLTRLLPTLIIVSMIGPLALNIIMPSMPGLAVALQASKAEVQLTLSLFLASMAISQLFIGGLADRFGRRPVLLVALTFYVTASIAAAFATNILMLVLARIFQAAGATAGLTLSRTVVRDLAPRESAASMIGYVTMGMVVAPLVAPALGGYLDDTFGWRVIFFTCAALGLVAGLIALFQLPETRPASVVGQSMSDMIGRSLQVIRNRAFMGYALGSGLTSAVFFAFLGGAPYLIVETMGLPKTTYGLWFICLSGGYMIGNFCSGRFSERFGTSRMIMIGNIIGCTGVSVMFLLASSSIMTPAAIFLPNLLMSIGNGFLLPNAIAGAVSVDPKAAGAASGVVGFLQMGMGALASFVCGQLTTTTALPMAAMMFMLSVSAWLALVWGKRG